jgi:hypothetical protein
MQCCASCTGRRSCSSTWEAWTRAFPATPNGRGSPPPSVPVYDAFGTTGPFYAYRVLAHEDIAQWQHRVVADLHWGDARLAAHVPGYRKLSFAPPYGNFGQVSTDDPAIPVLLGALLRKRFGLVFVQQPARYALPGETLVPRLQITRRMAGGDIHAWLNQQLPS